MTVYVKGFDYNSRLDNLLDIIHSIIYPVTNKIFDTLPADQKAYFQKNRMPDIFSPDGNDYNKPKGTINFYTSGFVKSAAEKMLKGALKALKAKGFKVGTLKGGQSGMMKSYVVRIPIVENPHTDYKGPPEIQWANRNAYHIFKELLGFDPDDEYGSSFTFTADELIQRIEMLRQHDPDWVKKNVIKPKDTKTQPKPEPGDEWKQEPEPPSENPHDDIIKQIGQGLGGARMIDPGLDFVQLWSRLNSLQKLARWAKEHGFNEMYVA